MSEDEHLEPASTREESKDIRAAREELEINSNCHEGRILQLHKLGDLLLRNDNLDEAIQCKREAVEMTAPNQLEVVNLIELVDLNYRRYSDSVWFKGSGAPYLDDAIKTQRHVLELLPDSRSQTLNLKYLGDMLFHRYNLRKVLWEIEQCVQDVKRDEGECSSSVAALRDLEEALKVSEEALGTAEKDCPDRPLWLLHLGTLYDLSYQETKVAERLERAILLTREARRVMGGSDTEVATQLSRLLVARYVIMRETFDIEEAITLARETVTNTALETRNLSLGALSYALFQLYQTTKSVDSLDEAIDFSMMASEEVIRGDKAGFTDLRNCNLLCRLLSERYETTGDERDLDNSIVFVRYKTEIMHPERVPWLESLVKDWWRQIVGHDANYTDLEQATQHPANLLIDGSSHVTSLIDLADRLYMRYITYGWPGDIVEAVDVMRRLVKLSKRSSHLRLGTFLLRLWYEKKDQNAVNEATWVSKQLFPDTDASDRSFEPARHEYLRYKALELLLRYETSGKLELIEDAILTGEEVLGMSGIVGNRTSAVDAMASILYRKFCTTRDQSDLDKAIVYCEEVCQATPKDERGLGNCLIRHCRYLFRRYKFTLNPADLDEAVRLGREAVRVSSNTVYLSGEFLDSLAACLYERFLLLDNRADLNEAIHISRQALDTKLEDLLNNCAYFLNLSTMLCELHTLMQEKESLDHLGEALRFASLARQAVEMQTMWHPNLAQIMCCLPQMRPPYFPGMSPDDPQSTIHQFRERLEADVQECSVRARHTTDLAMALSSILSHAETADINECVSLGRDAITMAEKGHILEDLSWHFSGLSMVLSGRFRITDNPEDLSEAITLAQRSIEIAAEDDPRMAVYLIIYALAIHSRYLGTGRLADINECIEIGLKGWCISSCGESNGDRFNQLMCAGNMAQFLEDRYLREGQTLDLKRAFEFRRLIANQSIALGKDQSSALSLRHAGSRAVSPVFDTVATPAMSLILPDTTDWSHLLYSLSSELLTHCKEFQSSELIHYAILMCQTSVKSTPRRHKQWPERQELLGKCFVARYDINKPLHATDHEQRAIPNLMNDLHSALSSLQEVVDALSGDDPIWVSALYPLGRLYSDRYRLFGDVGDLKMSLAVLQECTEATTDNDGQLSALLRLQGLAFIANFVIFNRRSDIELAKKALWQGLEIMSSDCPTRPGHLSDLADTYRIEYCNIQNRESLNIALDIYEAAYGVCTNSREPQLEDHCFKILTGRGFSYLERYKTTNAAVDLEKTIGNMKETLKMLPIDSPSRIVPLVSLANVHVVSYNMTGDNTCLATADQLVQEAADIATSFVSSDNNSCSEWRLRIGEYYRSRYDATKQTSSLDLTISFLHEAFELSPLVTTRDSERFVSIARSLADALKLKGDWDKAYTAINRAILLIVATTPRFLDVSETQVLLSRISNLASEGAALAISANRLPREAIQLLEAGRGVAMLALNQLRLDLGTSKRMSDGQREQILSFQQELDSPHATVQNTQIKGEEVNKAARRIRVGRELNKFLHDKTPYVSHVSFQQEITSPHLANAASGGPIVIVNVSYRCDAFLIRGGWAEVLPLPMLSAQLIQDKIDEGNLTSLRILEWLWDSIVSPVLDALGYTAPPPLGDPWPHIWWIPTGPLSKFPLHAAGRHMDEGCFNSTLDRVISSYSASIRALDEIVFRKERATRSHGQETQQALVVSMEVTPGTSTHLPHAIAEAQAVESVCKAMSVKTVRKDQCTRAVVLEHLPNSDIFHFAGHGYTDNVDPAKSHLRLEDWMTSPLTVADLIAINLRKKPLLAYLGACGTGEIQDARHLDESVHLINACQLAGFRHVIGTLCRVDDKTCVDVASITYEVIRKGGMTDDSVSEGLHHAVCELRDRWRSGLGARKPTEVTPEMEPREIKGNIKEGDVQEKEERLAFLQRDIVDCDSDEDDCGREPLHWAPYVHYGT
ncbi:Ff.00g080290.m01.CDS01 [Fusarium sp. VM40]|nr:Ff.00g080290.m01.CDS01 [Fusarium sp. VM40]